MKLRKISTTFVAIVVVGLSQVSIADTVGNAYRFCSALDATGLLNKPCDVSGSNQSIDVTMDTTSSEAMEMCSFIVTQASQVGAHFDRGWKVRIYSPYSSGNTIAQCNF
jgi:hypothetical protein